MKKARSILVIAVTAVFLASAGPLAARQGITIQKNVTVTAGESQDNIFTLGGSAVVDGTVRHSVIALGGTVTVSGEVGEAVVGFGSRIVIKSTAVIKGDVVSIGGTLEKEPGCSIRGDTVYLQGSDITRKMFQGGLLTGIFSFSFIPFILFVKLIVIFAWFILVLVGAALFPKPITTASAELRKSFGTAFAIGFLAHIVLGGLLVFAALLCIILIGIPILFGLIAAAVLIKIFGRLVVLHYLGDSLLRAFGSRKSSVVGTAIVGLLLVGLISFLPIIGLLFGLVLNMVGWGIAIRTKFGKTENVFEKKQVAPPAAPPASSAA